MSEYWNDDEENAYPHSNNCTCKFCKEREQVYASLEKVVRERLELRDGKDIVIIKEADEDG